MFWWTSENGKDMEDTDTLNSEGKVCSRCKRFLALTEFGNHRGMPDGHRRECKPCWCEWKRAWRLRRRELFLAQQRAGNARVTKEKWKEYRERHYAGPGGDKARERSREAFRSLGREGGKDHNLRKRFGITLEQWKLMVEAQGGVCAICRQEPGKRGFFVDHCHGTQVIRGLLCGKCNTGIGMLRDDPEIVENALAYLRGIRPFNPMSTDGLMSNLG